jgi:hypothetical protein
VFIGQSELSVFNTTRISVQTVNQYGSRTLKRLISMDQGRLDAECKASTLNLWKHLHGSQIVVCTNRQGSKENQGILQS